MVLDVVAARLCFGDARGVTGLWIEVWSVFVVVAAARRLNSRKELGFGEDACSTCWSVSVDASRCARTCEELVGAVVEELIESFFEEIMEE